MTDALFHRDGDGYVGSLLTQGAWNPAEANGSTVLALLGQCLEGVPSLVPMLLSRLTVDLVLPVPLHRRLHVTSSILREGKKIQVVQLLLTVEGVEHVRATALRLRLADVSDTTEWPDSTTDERPADALPRPEDLVNLRSQVEGRPGFLSAVDLRRAPYRDREGNGYWMRLEAEVIAGEPITPTARMTIAFDFANLIGVTSHSPKVTLINPDVTAHVLRPPTGEWVAITGETRFHPAMGRGISYAYLSDRDGLWGISSVSQLMQPR